MSELPKLEVRPYRPADEEACLAIFDSNVPHAFLPHEREQFQQYLSAPGGPYYVVVSDDALVGCGGTALAEDDATTGVLCWGIIHREWQKNGIGAYFVRWRITDMRSQWGIQRVQIETIEQNLGFFERLGFRTFAHMPDHYAPGWDCYRMRTEEITSPDLQTPDSQS